MRYLNRRSVLVSALTMAAAFNASCAGEKMMIVYIFNYWPLPLADVFINGRWGGAAPAKEPDDEAGGGAGSSVGGVPVQSGKQTVKWMLSGPPNSPRLRETITATAELSPIPADHKVIAIHIYPDETVFVESAVHVPNARPK